MKNSFLFKLGHITQHMNREEFKQSQIKILEWIFQGKDKILTLKKNHPAKIRWNYFEKIYDSFVKWPEDLNYMNTLARTLLDNYFIVEATGGKIQSLNPGSLGNYGDKLVQNKLLSEISDENKFADVFLELSFAAWNKSKGFIIHASEENGMPDFTIEIKDFKYPIIVDCKNIHKGTKLTRFGHVIKKANKQIKNHSDKGYGLVAIDVTDFITPINKITDEIPEIIRDIENEIKPKILKNNSSVNYVMLIWHDWQMLGSPPNSSMITLRRRSLLITHPEPKLPNSKTIPMEEYGNTVNFWIHWSPRR